MMRKQICLFTSLFMLVFFSFAQDPLPTKMSWDLLQSVQLKPKFVKEVNFDMLFPIFPEALLKYQGQLVTIKGYCVPVDKEGKKIALSATNYASCFFCGKAGPASVLTVNLKQKKKYKIDAYKTFIGKLRLNNNDIREFYFILDDAVEIN
jgi:hypothetical protein